MASDPIIADRATYQSPVGERQGALPVGEEHLVDQSTGAGNFPGVFTCPLVAGFKIERATSRPEESCGFTLCGGVRPAVYTRTFREDGGKIIGRELIQLRQQRAPAGRHSLRAPRAAGSGRAFSPAPPPSPLPPDANVGSSNTVRTGSSPNSRRIRAITTTPATSVRPVRRSSDPPTSSTFGSSSDLSPLRVPSAAASSCSVQTTPAVPASAPVHLPAAINGNSASTTLPHQHHRSGSSFINARNHAAGACPFRGTTYACSRGCPSPPPAPPPLSPARASSAPLISPAHPHPPAASSLSHPRYRSPHSARHRPDPRPIPAPTAWRSGSPQTAPPSNRSIQYPFAVKVSGSQIARALPPARFHLPAGRFTWLLLIALRRTIACPRPPTSCRSRRPGSPAVKQHGVGHAWRTPRQVADNASPLHDHSQPGTRSPDPAHDPAMPATATAQHHPRHPLRARLSNSSSGIQRLGGKITLGILHSSSAEKISRSIHKPRFSSDNTLPRLMDAATIH